jgi:hypothetical protein
VLIKARHWTLFPWHDTCCGELRSKKRREDSERSRLSSGRLSYLSI